MSKFNPSSVKPEQLTHMMRFVNLQRMQNQLRIAQEESPALYFGMVKLINRGIQRKDKARARLDPSTGRPWQ